MARPADPNSNRQRGFRLLNKYWRASRADKIDILMEQLGVSRRYAETIYASHRQEGKDQGKYVTTYRVLDQRDGKPCSPHLSSHVILKAAVKKSHYLSAESAKLAYLEEQQQKIDTVKSL
jgi:hypothetical protein